MNSLGRVRFTETSPIPHRGVVLPNVFPPADKGLDLHDIVKGYVPTVHKNEPHATGWLILAAGNEGGADYIDPALTLDEQEQIEHDPNRMKQQADIEVYSSFVIPRYINKILRRNIGGPVFDEWGRMAFSKDVSDAQLTVATPVESAVGFSGHAVIDDKRQTLAGIHFPSGHQQGWVSIHRKPAVAEPPK